MYDVCDTAIVKEAPIENAELDLCVDPLTDQDVEDFYQYVQSGKFKPWLDSDIEKNAQIFDGRYLFLWGVKSGDDLSSSQANLYTMNDIDLTYDSQTFSYCIGVETIYSFDTVYSEIIHYCNLLVELREWLLKRCPSFQFSKEPVDHSSLEYNAAIMEPELSSNYNGASIEIAEGKFRRAVKTYIHYLLERM